MKRTIDVVRRFVIFKNICMLLWTCWVGGSMLTHSQTLHYFNIWQKYNCMTRQALQRIMGIKLSSMPSSLLVASGQATAAFASSMLSSQDLKKKILQMTERAGQSPQPTSSLPCPFVCQAGWGGNLRRPSASRLTFWSTASADSTSPTKAWQGTLPNYSALPLHMLGTGSM